MKPAAVSEVVRCSHQQLRAPFPWFGGKSAVAAEVWRRFGDVRNYVEPFFGSGAVLLARPQPFQGYETVNDADGYICNFWRAVQHAPDEVAKWADYPVIENDLHARNKHLIARRAEFTRKLEDDPDFFDAKIAGWWVWGQSCWIGGGWAAGAHRTRPRAGEAGVVAAARTQQLRQRIDALSARLRNVHVFCGDWSRVCTHCMTAHLGTTAVFLDPPYSDKASRDTGLYAVDCLSVAHKTREWAIMNGENPQLRIALCGYDGEHEMPPNWSVFAWKANGGCGNQSNGRGRDNKVRERIWFSPHCVKPHAADLFDAI